MVNIGNDWDDILAGEFKREYYLKLREFLKSEYKTQIVYPDMYDIFNAFKYTPYSEVKAVILGQDPYHEPGQAHGLSFSVPDGVRQPPSLINIFKELESDMGIEAPDLNHGCLIPWARSGVMLLNTTLTVRAHQAGSHRGRGWEILTDRVIELLNECEKPIVFILWGRDARSKIPLITNAVNCNAYGCASSDKPRHLILDSVHPSPLSAHRGFFGGRYFSRANEFLVRSGETPVDWKI